MSKENEMTVKKKSVGKQIIEQLEENLKIVTDKEYTFDIITEDEQTEKQIDEINNSKSTLKK